MRALLANTRTCNHSRALPAEHREVISDIARRMGGGMADFIGRDLGQGTEDQADYDLYCHYVAGLVGEGLSRQFAACGLESEGVSQVLREDAQLMCSYLPGAVASQRHWM